MRKLAWLWVVVLILGLAACKKESTAVFGTLSGTVTYAESADKPLDDKANVGDPATDVMVRISLLETPKYSGGQPLYVQGEPLFELTPDSSGGYKVELPYGQYMLEVVGKDAKILAKRMIKLKRGQPFRADFNVAK